MNDTLNEELCIVTALRRCPGAQTALHLAKDESFLLYRDDPKVNAAPVEASPEAAAAEMPVPAYRPFLSFADVLAAIREELLLQDPLLPRPRYVLEKWAAKGDFNLSFFRFKGELIEVEPPNEDYHMEQTARFELDGDEVVRFRALTAERERTMQNAGTVSFSE